MKVIWSRAAEDDLVEIAAYIKQDAPKQAESFMRELAEADEAIADMPLAFGLVPRLEDRGIPKRAYGRYVILYQIEAGRLHRVSHGARDHIRALFPDD